MYALINGHIGGLLSRLIIDDDKDWNAKKLDNLGGLNAVQPITMSDGGLVYIELRPDLDYDRIRGTLKPVRVTRGIFEGWELPVFDDDDQELYFVICVPTRWDAVSDIFCHVDCYLDTANTGKKFGLRLAYEVYSPVTDAVPDTSTNLDVQTSTETAPIYQSFEVSFTIPHGSIITDDKLALRLYRIAADPAGDEIAGEVVINHVGAIFRRDKLGAATL
ncbi:hypothetical protein ES703_119943 [subsurface metagenome]